jgi:hypothetical protein
LAKQSGSKFPSDGQGFLNLYTLITAVTCGNYVIRQEKPECCKCAGLSLEHVYIPTLFCIIGQSYTLFERIHHEIARG